MDYIKKLFSTFTSIVNIFKILKILMYIVRDFKHAYIVRGLEKKLNSY